ncbi:hypothetical protein AB0P21_35630 [Kribbella sp. NPDC056861]|uniref:hypothetical protein n=1 Tax=Kribbella sp. NPDC056861 TaxID=3154857 RepID=UPI00343CA307
MNRFVVEQVLRTAFPHVGPSDPVEYFGEAGSATEALMYSWLYWPDLVELYGAVFLLLSDANEEYISERLGASVGDEHPDWAPLAWADAIDSFNWFEVSYLFRSWSGLTDELHDDLHRELGSRLIPVWSARLTAAYPDREFSVTLLEPDDSVGWRIQVSQVSPPLQAPPGWDPQRRSVLPDPASPNS